MRTYVYNAAIHDYIVYTNKAKIVSIAGLKRHILECNSITTVKAVIVIILCSKFRRIGNCSANPP